MLWHCCGSSSCRVPIPGESLSFPQPSFPTSAATGTLPSSLFPRALARSLVVLPAPLRQTGLGLHAAPPLSLPPRATLPRLMEPPCHSFLQRREQIRGRGAASSSHRQCGWSSQIKAAPATEQGAEEECHIQYVAEWVRPLLPSLLRSRARGGPS
jgi:hypothetical protein